MPPVAVELLSDLVDRGIDIEQGLLSPRTRPLAVKTRLRRAWKEAKHESALEWLSALALELDHAHPAQPPRSERGWKRP